MVSGLCIREPKSHRSILDLSWCSNKEVCCKGQVGFQGSPPSVVMTFLRVSYNSETFTLEVAADRQKEILELVAKLLNKCTVIQREIVSLFRKFSFTLCVQQCIH